MCKWLAKCTERNVVLNGIEIEKNTNGAGAFSGSGGTALPRVE